MKHNNVLKKILLAGSVILAFVTMVSCTEFFEDETQKKTPQSQTSGSSSGSSGSSSGSGSSSSNTTILQYSVENGMGRVIHLDIRVPDTTSAIPLATILQKAGISETPVFDGFTFNNWAVKGSTTPASGSYMSGTVFRPICTAASGRLSYVLDTDNDTNGIIYVAFSSSRDTKKSFSEIYRWAKSVVEQERSYLGEQPTPPKNKIGFKEWQVSGTSVSLTATYDTGTKFLAIYN